jgi:hypothetical protein
MRLKNFIVCDINEIKKLGSSERGVIRLEKKTNDFYRYIYIHAYIYIYI